jgi:signal transduction histidine kinase/CheY-like chemotaxis protein/HPt (histidine-containing phosphotransfer) domain-containing protein
MRVSRYTGLIKLVLGFCVIFAGAVYGLLQLYHEQRDTLLRDGLADAEEYAGAIKQQTDRRFDGLLITTSFIRDLAREVPNRDAFLALFLPMANALMQRNAFLNGVYVGLPDGSFHAVQAFSWQDSARIGFDITGKRAILMRELVRDPVSGEVVRNEFLMPSKDGTGFLRSDQEAPSYDPRQRPWYIGAERAGRDIWTKPYTFATAATLGITYAVPVFDSGGVLRAVIGVDIELTEVSRIVDAESRRIGGTVFIATGEGEVLGHSALMRRFRAENTTRSGGVGDLGDADALAMFEAMREDGVSRIIDTPRGLLVAASSRSDIPSAPFYTYVGLPEKVVQKDAEQRLRRNLILAFAGFVLFSIGAFYTLKLREKSVALAKAEEESRAARVVAEDATRAKSNFLATMSHEIRTPMNGVMSMAEMLELTPMDGEQRRMSKVIRESAQALLTVINDILDFSKIEAGKLDIESVPFSLGDLADGIGELLAPRADDKMLELVVDIDPALPDKRLGDPTRVRQVLLNLGGNAVKFTHEGSITIRIRPMAEPHWLRFEVIDSGIGLTEEQQARLFQPFSQADSSTARKYGGTGLGLSICNRLCELMGGRIGVTSSAGHGSTFWFELPLPPEDGAEAPRPKQDIAPCRVLLAGLPAEQAALAAQYLRAAGITAIDMQSTMPTARQRLAAGDIDLVLVDARSPGGADHTSVLDLPASQATDARFALVAPRSLVSTLDAAARAHFRLALTYPLNRHGLWRAAALALDLIAGDEAESAFREDMAWAPPDIETARAGNALVLVAEDNLTNQVVIRQMLSRMGFACEIGDNGAQALEMYRNNSGYGLLLTDFHMPEMDGFELTAAIRGAESPDGPRLPIVALTADALTGTEQQCLDAGMDGYLTKPINSRALGDMLTQWLPQALPLRVPASKAAAPKVTTAAPAATPGPDWDTDIFDPAPLAEMFGSLNDAAKGFLSNFVADAATRVAEVEAAMAKGDLEAARFAAHTLKGSGRSMGANRLGNLASDLQDACDANDTDTAALMAELLPDTWRELNETLPQILRH